MLFQYKASIEMHYPHGTVHYVALHCVVAHSLQWCRLSVWFFRSDSSFNRVLFTIQFHLVRSLYSRKQSRTSKYEKKKTNRKKNLDLVVVLLQSNELDLQDAIFYRSVQWSDSSFYFLFDAPRFVLLIRRFVSRIKESNS